MLARIEHGQLQVKAHAHLLRLGWLLRSFAQSEVNLTEAVDDVVWCGAHRRSLANLLAIHIHQHLWKAAVRVTC